MKYAVNEEGVAALQSLSDALPECAEKITQAAEALQTAFDENKEGLGPHDTSIESILEDIKAAEADAAEPVQDLSDKLADIADAYQDIIDNDRYNSGK